MGQVIGGGQSAQEPENLYLARRSKRFLVRCMAVMAAAFWSRMPLPIVRFVGGLIGRVLCVLAPERRRTAEQNLEACFGERFTPGQRRHIVVCSCQNIVTSLMELFKVARLGPERLRKLVDVEGAEHLERAAARGRGVIVVTAHYGNWEVLGAVIGLLGHRLAVIARDAPDSPTAQLVNSARRRLGMEVLGRDDLEAMIGWLREGKVLGILPDQRQVTGGKIMPFMGRPATTALGPAVLALRTGAALVPGFARRTPSGRFQVVFFPELELPEDQAEGLSRGEAVEALSQLVNNAIADEITRFPDQWLWFHDRWRIGPRRKKKKQAPQQAN
ncbi:MAG: lysophospholipid acyltransferase family protein [Armatimonadetes bacterium]|nr:lysophospholipid acyltransferase family protein [Armatimonadota bacterium]